MTIDKYTKIILTIIAVGIVLIIFNLYNFNFVQKVNATPNNQGIGGMAVDGKWVYIISKDGKYACKYGKYDFSTNWSKISC